MRASPIRNSRGNSGVMHYAVVRDAALGWHRENAVSSQAREEYAACYRNGGTAGGSKIMSIKQIWFRFPALSIRPVKLTRPCPPRRRWGLTSRPCSSVSRRHR